MKETSRIARFQFQKTATSAAVTHCFWTKVQRVKMKERRTVYEHKETEHVAEMSHDERQYRCVGQN
jgi:hypothetical protein